MRAAAPTTALAIGVGLLIGGPGCQTETDGGADSLSGRDTIERTVQDRRKSQLFEEPIGRKAGTTYISSVAVEVQPRGTMPYDNMTLPVVSPDGRYLATQIGLPPTWETILAEPGAAVPDTSRIEIYELGFDSADPPQPVAIVDEPAVLGRSVSDRGFLVESPRPNGARWIGLANWETGSVEWLVRDDGRVSAFATLGPMGQLAWSSRAVNGEQWDLMAMAQPGGEAWRLPGSNGQWLFPTWSGVGDTLFVLLLREDALDAVFMDGSSLAQVRRTLRSVPLATDGATIDTAYQTVSAVPVMNDVPHGGRAQFAFYHPSRFGAAVWEPPAPPTLLERLSLAAVVDPRNPDFALLVNDNQLKYRKIDDRFAFVDLLAGLQIPRLTRSELRPYILLNPLDGEVAVTVIRLREIE